MPEVKTVEQEQKKQAPSGEIRVPIAALHEEVHIPFHVDTGRLTRPQGETLRRMKDGLEQRGAVLENGRRVIAYSDVVRWLLENVSVKDNHPTRRRGRKKPG